jgi:hypothetical protein
LFPLTLGLFPFKGLGSDAVAYGCIYNRSIFLSKGGLIKTVIMYMWYF